MQLANQIEQQPDLYQMAGSLENLLGDPLNPEMVFSFKRSVELDEKDDYPEHACDLLNQWGMQDYYIPVECGGKLFSFEELLSLIRVIARRDYTVAVAHVKTYLGAVCVWLGGTEAQKTRLAWIIKGGGQVSLGLTEKIHGSDILGSEVVATSVVDGFTLAGEKWLINNATRSAALTVLARTRAEAGARGFSLFLVEKEQLEGGSFTLLPKIKTHGIRGADISGIRFDQCLIPASSLIGPEGAALEITLKAFQLTRTLIPALSLGAADTALRTTLKFTLERRLYGGRVWDLPQVQRTVVESFVQLLICECVAISAARALHVATEQMSVWSAVAKYYVPVQVERLVKQLGVVLGARSYLREEHDWGIFQKIVRDNEIASLFDGSTMINLNVIIQQLHQLAEYSRKEPRTSEEEVQEHLESIFCLKKPLRRFEARRLELLNRGRDDIVQGLKMSLARIADFKREVDLDVEVSEQIIGLTTEVLREIDARDKALADCLPGHGNTFHVSPEQFDLAKRHCVLHAAAACVHTWCYNRSQLRHPFAAGEWAVLCLHNLLMELQPGRAALPLTTMASTKQELLRLYQEKKLFSLVPFCLASTA